MGGAVKVAVIGAGVSGLVAARELRREGHRVTALEKGSRLGGTWVYDSRVESDPLGLDPSRNVVHGSLYLSLRANTTRDLMSFSDYKFGGDPTDFPRHQEVLEFVESFANEFGLLELIRFNSEVVRVEQEAADQWIVESRSCETGTLEEEVFQAVVVCTGHNSQPSVPQLPGSDKWPGKQMHSHNYRVSGPFRDQVVVIVGAGPSAYDIAREVASVAKQVYLSSTSPHVKASKLVDFTNMYQHSKIESLHEDGAVSFEDGHTIVADSILYCTRYKFNFPYLKTNGIVSVDDNRVGPLYKHVFPPRVAPSLSFVGIPSRAILFRMMELQSKWIAHALSAKLVLPSREQMLGDIQKEYKLLNQLGIPKHRTHALNPFKSHHYLDWMAAQVGSPPIEDRLKSVHNLIFMLAIQIESTYLEFRDGFSARFHEYYYKQVKSTLPFDPFFKLSKSSRTKQNTIKHY